MKKVIALILAVSLLMLSACSGGSGSKSSTSGEDVTVTFWATPIEENFEEDFNKYVIPALAESHPNIHVELEMLTWEGVADRLQVALKTGETPDLFLDGAARTAKLPAMNVLAPVDDVYNSYNDWVSSVQSIGVIDGTHYLIPATQIAASRISVNVTLAQELGVADMLPEDKMSWNIQDFYKFVEAAAKAGKDKGISGIYLYAGSSTSDDILYSLMMSNGADIVDTNSLECKANSPEAVEVIDVLGKMVQNGYAQTGAATAMGGDANTPFINRQCVVVLNMAAATMHLQQKQLVDEGYLDKTDDIENYGIPSSDGHSMVAASWGANCFALFNHDDDAKTAAAKEVIKAFLDSKEMSQAIWNNQTTYSPSRDTGIQFQNDDEQLVKLVSEMADWSGKYGNSNFGILESWWPEVRNAFYPQLQAVYTGEKTAQQAMDQFVQDTDKALESYK